MKKIFLIILIACGVAVVGGVYWRFAQADARRFRITFLDVGQGDAALIQFRNGQHWLVDCGPDSAVLAQLGQHLPWYARTIDMLLVTHPDSDHYAGCIDVLRRYRVKRIITNGDSKPDEQYQTFARAVADETGSAVFIERIPKQVAISGTLIDFLAPEPSFAAELPAGDSNNRSIVFRLSDAASQTSVFFAADMEEPLERAILKTYCPEAVFAAPRAVQPCTALQAGVLKVGHHGSETSSAEALLGAVDPRTAIISVGERNRFGHPSLRVVRRLERRGVTVLRTDKRGAIVID